MTTPLMPDPAALNKAFAEEVRVLLTRRKVNQKTLQDDLGWSRAKVNRLVNAEQTWGMSEMLAFCDYMDIDLGVILSTAKAVALEQTAARSGTVTERDLAMAEDLRAEAERRQITNVELQRRSRVAKSTLGGIMDGTRAADPSELGAICAALGITIYELFERAEARLAAESRGADQQASGG